MEPYHFLFTLLDLRRANRKQNPVKDLKTTNCVSHLFYINFARFVLDETNLCNGKPVDGLTTLRNGTLVAFRGELSVHECVSSCFVLAILKTKPAVS